MDKSNLNMFIGFTVGVVACMICSSQNKHYEKVIERETVHISKKLTDWEILMMAVADVESGYKSNAHNQTTNAAGIFQITPVYIKEVNKRSKSKYTHVDRFNISKSIEMFNLYNEIYNSEKNIDKAIKLHNPNASSDYKDKIKNRIKRIKQYEDYRTYFLINTDNYERIAD